METMSAPVAGRRQFTGRPYLWLGIVLVLLGPALYVAQLRARILSTPWYVAGLATAGVLLLLLALLRRPTVWRVAAFALFGLFAAGQWYFLLSLSKAPAYTGPVSDGTSVPAFRASLADGSEFNQDSLRGAQNTALVFFRGRW